MEDPDAYRTALDVASDTDYESDDEATPPATLCGSEYDDEDTPPATPTDFAAQVCALTHSEDSKPLSRSSSSGPVPPKRPSLADHRRLSDLCLDIREACETRGINKDIKKACKWLLNRNNVPQRLRTILWEQLLRKNIGDADSDSEEELRDLRRTSADPTIQDLCRAAAEYFDAAHEEQRRGRSRRLSETSGQYRDRSRTARCVGRKKIEEPVENGCTSPTRSVSIYSRDENGKRSSNISSLTEKYEFGVCPGMRAEGCRNEKNFPERVSRSHSDGDIVLAEQQAKREEALLALKHMEIEEPTGCTCAAKCHCIFDGKSAVPSTAPMPTDRPARAGLAPKLYQLKPDARERTLREIFDAARLDLGFSNKRRFPKMPEEKRDSILPDDNRKSSSEVSRSSIRGVSRGAPADIRKQSSSTTEWHDARIWSEPSTPRLIKAMWPFSRGRTW